MPTIEYGSPIASNETATFSNRVSAAEEWPRDSGKQIDAKQIAQRLTDFLVHRRPAAFCDDCAADRLGLSHRRQANRVARALAKTPTFWRTIGACSVCSKYKQIIRSV
jgi:hypothetical protein